MQKLYYNWPMKYVYLSSGQFGAAILADLKVKPELVITQPDKKGGRGLKQIIATPVKQYCQEHKIKYQTDLIVKGWNPFLDCQLALVADYGVIINAALLTQPKLGFFNIHPSLLPKYRGSTPLQSAILNDEKVTGVSIIKMDEKVDHGPLVAQEKLNVDINDSYLTLLNKTAKLGAEMFNKLNFNHLSPISQNHLFATYTKKLTKQDGYIPIEQLIPYLTPIFKKYNLLHLLPNQAEKPIYRLKLYNLIRALSPWPGVWSQSQDKIIKLVSSNFATSFLQLQIAIDGKFYF